MVEEIFMWLRVLVTASVLLSLAACSSPFKEEELMSPCTGLDGSPCGPKRPVNDWWLKGGDSA